MAKIDQMRQSYEMAALSEEDVADDPMVQFQTWFRESTNDQLPDWVETNAMTLSTADATGRVTSRVVLLKGVENGKFVFFTNYRSAKGRQIQESPAVSLCFFWPHLQRQVRVEGTAARTSRQFSQQYFHTRPRGSQIGAVASEQSTIVTAQQLQDQMHARERQYENQEVPCPEHWGGYAVSPTAIEFWQGRPNRLHDRIVYQRLAGDEPASHSWKIVRLSP